MGGISRYEKIALGATAIFVVLCLLLLIRPGEEPKGYTVTAEPGEGFAAEETTGDYPVSLLPGEKIDINAAPAVELQRLPGIGAKRAEDIVAHREAQGPFTSVEELAQISGIGPGTLSAIMDYITVSEE